MMKSFVDRQLRIRCKHVDVVVGLVADIVPRVGLEQVSLKVWVLMGVIGSLLIVIRLASHCM